MNNRLETFCDGVFAISITLLILGIKIPPVASIHSIAGFWHEILGDWPSWFGFTLSFIIILIAWAGHHDVFKLLNKSNARFMYANGFLLFTVVVLPYSTELMADYMQTDFAQPAITFYCFTIFVHSIGWFLFFRTALHPVDLTRDEASKISLETNMVKSNRYALVFYLILCILSFWLPILSAILMTLSWSGWVFVQIRMAPKNK